jgi:ParB-like chromosome segregation protein Spo0J
MSALAENIVREQLNPVDQWRAIERLAVRALLPPRPAASAPL